MPGQGNTFLSQIPLRASADVNTCRVIGLSGANTGAQVADHLVEPLGVSAEWSFLPPIVDYSLSTVQARGSTKDPISYHGNGGKCHAVVGSTPFTSAGRAMAAPDGSGKIIPLVAPAWQIGIVPEAAAPAGAKAELYIAIEWIDVASS